MRLHFIATGHIISWWTDGSMNIKQIEALIKYILALAARNDYFGQRPLSAIHILKYLYLADLAYANKREGETFTGIEWRFHKWGPWSVPAWQTVGREAQALGARSLPFPGDDEERDRWLLEDADDALEEVRREIPIPIRLYLQNKVQNFANDTKSLLEYVYRTYPMLQAAPGETLIFIRKPLEQPVSVGQRRIDTAAIRRRISAIRPDIVKAIAVRTGRTAEEVEERASTYREPKYDEEFLAFVENSDKSEHQPLSEGEYTVSVDQSVWHSEARREREVAD